MNNFIIILFSPSFGDPGFFTKFTTFWKIHNQYQLRNGLVVQKPQNYFCNTDDIIFYHLHTYYLINSIAIRVILKQKMPTPNRQTNIPHKKNINCNRVFEPENASAQTNKPYQPVFYTLHANATTADGLA